MFQNKTYNLTSNFNQNVAIFSFYSFINIFELEILLSKLLLLGKKKSLKGTVIIAEEGFNGSISGNHYNCEVFVEELINLTKAQEIDLKINYAQTHPFSRLKVKIKNEIIAIKIKALDIPKLKGSYIKPEDWDNFISRNDVITIDTRNDYEVAVGSFIGSINPKIQNFREFPAWVKVNKEKFEDTKIAMFCTGGVRCEKSTAYLKSLGYDNIFHLKGGILQYLETTKNINNKWQGECFVFDNRIMITKDLIPKYKT